MSQEERFNTRDRHYSAWHRRLSTRRFVGIEKAQLLAMIDLDASLYVEYDDASRDPLALIETAMDVGQAYKSAIVTQKLAMRAGLPCFVVLYSLSESHNPADERFMDIKSFRIKRLNPNPEQEWKTITPQEWAEKLIAMRTWQAGRIDREVNS